MEEFKFRVKSVFHLKQINRWSLDGTLESGRRIWIGDEGIIDGEPSLRVTVTAIPIVCGATDDLLTLCIAPPDFPPEKREGALIVGMHRPTSPNPG